MVEQLFRTTLLLVVLVFLQGCVTTAQLQNQYPSKPTNKAFAMASDGRSGMSWGKASIDDAINTALQFCRQSGALGCRITKINSQIAKLKPNNYFSDTTIENFGHSRLFRCDDISKSRAYSLLLQGHFYLDRDGDGHPCEWEKTTYRRSYAPSYTPSSNCHWVKGYRRKDGTYVSGHRRCR